MGNQPVLFITLLLVAAVGSVAKSDGPDDGAELQLRGHGRKSRQGGFFNVFQVVSFANGPCDGGSRNGTCYTEEECETRGGTNAGSCAAGFGVCCIITVSCGEQSNENCTYFESSGVMAGGCTAEICPSGDDICQLRLDFETFTITGPSLLTEGVTNRRPNSGAVTVNANDGDAIPVSNRGQCLTDTFSVSNPDGTSPPTICGINDGQHMYVESSDCCNKLSFKLGATGVGATIPSRQWNIKVTQYSCNFKNLAPEGCTQYFFGSSNNVIQSYNYNNGAGTHLASQDQVNCVRKERNNCRICWTTVMNSDFAISGKRIRNSFNGNLCCDYGDTPPETNSKGFDCLIIPGAVRGQDTERVGGPTPSYQCGNNKGLKRLTVCSNRSPFVLHFRSDKWETVQETGDDTDDSDPDVPPVFTTGQQRNNGFMIVYFMDGDNCNPAALVNVPTQI